jgi:hypothetical protein
MPLSIIRLHTSSAVQPFFIPALVRSTHSFINEFFIVFNLAGLSIHESSNLEAIFLIPFFVRSNTFHAQGITPPIHAHIHSSSREGNL